MTDILKKYMRIKSIIKIFNFKYDWIHLLYLQFNVSNLLGPLDLYEYGGHQL